MKGIRTVLTGEWSAARLVLALDATGGATEYGCAHGTVNASVVVDAAGRFGLPGIHVREHGGLCCRGAARASRVGV